MATVIRKTVSIFHDAFDALRTSTRVQWGIVIVLISLCGVGYLMAHHQEEARKAKVLREEAVRSERVRNEKVHQLFNFDEMPERAHAVVVGIDALWGDEALAQFVSGGELQALWPGTTVVTDSLLPPFYRQGHFEKLWNGDRSDLEEAKFFDRAEQLILIRPLARFKPSAAGGGMWSSTVEFMCREYSSLHAPTKEASVVLTGIGSTDEASFRNALSSLKDHQGEFEKLLK